MSADRLRELLRSRGREWPAALAWFEVLDSTNDELRERMRVGPTEAWSAVVAARQSAGRGRRGRSWASPEGNLYLSVLVPMPEQPASRPLVPLVAGVAVHQALADFGVASRLKWPNDVLVAGRKLAGISAEASSGGGRDGIVLGVGINVRVNPIGDLAMSMAETSEPAPDPLEVAAAVLDSLFARQGELLAGAAARLLDAWRERSIEWWGRPVEVISGEHALRGVAVGVDDGGALVLELPDGRRESVLAGEARELRLGRG